MPTGKKTKFPPVLELFQQSWETFTASISKLLIFTVAIVGIYAVFWIAVIVIFIALAAVTGLFTAFAHLGAAAITTLPIWLYILFGMYLIAVIIGMIVISSLGSIVPVLIVSQPAKDISVANKMKTGLGFVVPLLASGFLVFLLSFGGAFVFILPAIFFSLFFIFVNYEVILNNQRWMSALKRSVLIVRSNFGEIFVRILAYFLIYFCIGIFIPNLIIKTIPNISVLVNILSMLVNTLVSWFGLCFMVNLYKQARVGLEKEKGNSIAWMWVVSIVGWIFFIFILSASFRFLTSPGMGSFLEKLNINDILRQYSRNELNSPFNLQEL